MIMALGRPANALELYIWKPYPSFAGIVVPARDGESPEKASKRYLEAVSQDSDLRDLGGKEFLAKLPLRNFTKLTQADFTRRILVIANSPSQLNQRSSDMLALLTPLRLSGAVPYILPVAANARVETESASLIELLDTYFPSFLAIGGNDIDRRIFGERNTMSYRVNYRRDLFEAELLRRKIESITGKTRTWRPPGSVLFRQDRLVGICRGAQLAARVMGHYVGQDIACEIPHAIDHGNGLEGGGKIVDGVEPGHPIDIVATTNSVLSSFVGGLNQINVNTYHHQYMQIVKDALHPLLLAALSSSDGVAEALESPDGGILLLQFHPELMQERIGAQLMEHLVVFLTPMRLRCPQILSVVPM